jgi:hypothetical protein
MAAMRCIHLLCVHHRLLSRSNVRRIVAGASIDELADDIARRTLLHSLSAWIMRSEALCGVAWLEPSIPTGFARGGAPHNREPRGVRRLARREAQDALIASPGFMVRWRAAAGSVKR